MTTVESRLEPAPLHPDEQFDLRPAVALIWAGMSRPTGSEPIGSNPGQLAAWAAGEADPHRALGRLLIVAGRELRNPLRDAPLPMTSVRIAPPHEVLDAAGDPGAIDLLDDDSPVIDLTDLAPQIEIAVSPKSVVASPPRLGPGLAQVGPASDVRPVADPDDLPVRQVRQARAFFWIEMIGVLTLLLVAYQLWGTGFAQRKAQQQLRAGFEKASVAVPAASGSDAATVGGHPHAGVAKPLPLLPGGAVARLEIPAIHVDQFVVEGTGEEALKRGPGHYTGSPLPGQPGNVAIAGHRTTYGAPFSRLDELKSGDTIIATTSAGRFLYVLSHELTVSPGQTSVVDDYGDSRLTLTTCTPKFLATQRLIAVAVLQGPAPATPPAVRVSPPAAPASRPILTAGPAAAHLRHQERSPDRGAAPRVLLLGALLLALRYLYFPARRRLRPVAAACVIGLPVSVCGLLLLEQLVRLFGLDPAALPLAVLLSAGMVALGFAYRPVRRALPPFAAAVILAPFWIALTLMLFEQLSHLLPPNV